MTIQILGAFYGGHTIKSINVTPQVQQLANKQTTQQPLNILVSPETFDLSDPCYGVRKTLTVSYQYAPHLPVLAQMGVDGETLVLAPATQAQYIVISACIGHGQNVIDVTEVMQNYFANPENNNKIAVNSPLMQQIANDNGLAKNVPLSLTLQVQSPMPGASVVTISGNGSDELELTV